MKIKFFSEICCEVCNEVIHVHLEECPACKKYNASSSIYGDVCQAWDTKEIPEFSCEECKAIFKATKSFKEIQLNEGIDDTEWVIVSNS